MITYLKNKFTNLRIKLFLWLMGNGNHQMWNELIKHHVTDMNSASFGMIGEHCDLGYDMIAVPKNIYMDDYTRFQDRLIFISNKGKLRVKKFAAIGAGCIIIPGDHIPTVGVPQYLAGRLHINDIDNEIVIGEDSWIGAGTILLSHCSVGRGAVVAAGAVVSKPVPSYAVVAGVPAKIIATRFTIEQILDHEKQLYPENERMNSAELAKLFEEHFQGICSIGKSEMSGDDKDKLEKIKCELGISIY